MAFVLKRKITLEDVDGEWKDCFIEFNCPTYKAIKELQGKGKPEEQVELMVSFLAELFVAGKAWNGTEAVELKKEDLEDLPILILTKAFLALAGELTPKDTGN